MLAMPVATQAEEAWFRITPGPILLSTSPDAVGNADITITAAASAPGREYGDLQVPVTIGGIDATHAVVITGLPGAVWVPDGTTYGKGTISYPSAAEGTHSLTIEVRNQGGDLVASQAVELVIHPPLTASVPQTEYEVDKGGTLTITPSVANLITDGAVQWGSIPASLPAWLDLDENSGIITVDTTTAISVDDLILTAVDQTDYKDASTAPFSVAVNGACGGWTARTATEQSGWYSVAYGGGKFVAVAQDGTNRVMTSPDGITWTPRAAPEQNNWRSVTYAGGQFVVIGQSGTNRVMTSPDGITWTARAAPEPSEWHSVAYGGGRFVAVAWAGANRIMTSPDGGTWTPQAAPEQNNWYSVAYGGGQFVAVATTGTNRIMTSPDGITWTSRAAPGLSNWHSVTYGGGQFVAVAYAGTDRIMTSPDGITWTSRAAQEQNSWRSVIYGNGQFVAVAYDGTNRVMASPDGVTWTSRAAMGQSNWISVSYGGGQFVAVAIAGTNRVMTSNCN